MPTFIELLSCAKHAETKPKRVNKANPAQRGWDIALTADLEGDFSAFLRINARLPELCSAGLCYAATAGGKVTLLRVNGEHGAHSNPDGSRVVGAHIHGPTPAQLYVEPPAFANGPRHAYEVGAPLAAFECWQLMCWLAQIHVASAVQRAVHSSCVTLNQSLLDLG